MNENLSKCCNTQMLAGSNQCMSCGACGICGGICQGKHETKPEVNEESEMWREHNEDMKKMREKRRFVWQEAQIELEQAGFRVRRISPYQFRINDRLDIYPSNKRWHDIKLMKRGDIRNITYFEFVRKHFLQP